MPKLTCQMDFGIIMKGKAYKSYLLPNFIMISKYTNPCTRCGKERILKKKWKETTVTFSGTKIVVTRTLNVCPDKECQKVVDKELMAQRAKRDKIKKDREDRVAENLEKKAEVRRQHLQKTA